MLHRYGKTGQHLMHLVTRSMKAVKELRFERYGTESVTSMVQRLGEEQEAPVFSTTLDNKLATAAPWTAVDLNSRPRTTP